VLGAKVPDELDAPRRRERRHGRAGLAQLTAAAEDDQRQEGGARSEAAARERHHHPMML